VWAAIAGALSLTFVAASANAVVIVGATEVAGDVVSQATSRSYFNTPSSSLGDNFFVLRQGAATEQVGLPVGYASLALLPATYSFSLPADPTALNLDLTASAVPEPGSLTLVGLGLVVLGLAGLGLVRLRV
jgi:hypothetical protein